MVAVGMVPGDSSASQLIHGLIYRQARSSEPCAHCGHQTDAEGYSVQVKFARSPSV